MPKPISRRSLVRLAPLALLPAAACTSDARVGASALADQVPDATVEMRQAQAAFIGSAGGGSGVLTFRGQRYPFTVAGAGIGGIGASTIEAQGDVFSLRDISQFPGAYGQVRHGLAVGQMSSGELWLQNRNGVIMRLRARRTGLMLSLGGDAVIITMR
ncbi:hypothetical protein M0638_06055 [Roseomonas sp. NAR14]|uniref:Uncharacterized protein n=1 Tax=Roseomonas acroporae TaxID=2937791 RepID=A0A9X2BT75_9PROT|nr:hypothetical protein [Roseomonas acroporae]MCK8783942.1 hypothetical protein [Roseomonas acroporae]